MKSFIILILAFILGRGIFSIMDNESLKFLFAYLLGGFALVLLNYYSIERESRPAFTDFLSNFFRV